MKSCGEQINFYFTCRKISDWEWPLAFPFETGREVGCSKDVVGVVQVTCLKRNKMYSSIGRSSQILYLQLVNMILFCDPNFRTKSQGLFSLTHILEIPVEKNSLFWYIYIYILISNVLLFLIFFLQRRSQWSSSKK